MTNKDAPKIVVFPPLVALSAPIIAFGLGFLLPIRLLPPFWTTWSGVLGLIIFAIAVGLAGSGILAFKKSGTNVDPRKPSLNLAMGGPYRLTRNPMYLGMALLQLGFAFTFSLDWALIGAPIVLAILHYGVVLREEAYLIDKFGTPYGDYLSSTRRWL